ncbi:type II secretion system protein N [Caenimonas koreensis]|uniref:type II secretion system protein N n=1 Tax=Caenimonas koreensis TaxID=367474 RepID=UPI0037843F40
MALRSTASGPPRASWGWALAGAAIGLVVAMVLYAPARWLSGTVRDATGERLVLDDASGTIWTGSAQLVLTGGAGSTAAAALPTRIEWRMRPRWDGFTAQLQTACCTQAPVEIRLQPRWGGARITVADSQAQVPAALLVGLGTPWNTLQLDGDLQLGTQGLSVEWIEGRLSVAGQAELKAQRLSSRLSTLRPMGSYRITVTGGSAPTLQLQTLEGALQLSGSGQWVGSRLRFSGVATAAPEREDALSNLLNIIGRRSGARSIITLG